MQRAHDQYREPSYAHIVAVRNLAHDGMVDAQQHARPSDGNLQPQIDALLSDLWDQAGLDLAHPPLTNTQISGDAIGF